jgi:predicted lipoprotein with Yx(FWY)xxD motif
MSVKRLSGSPLTNLTIVLAAVGLLIGCGGGGGSTLPSSNNVAQPLSTANLKGAPGFITAAGFTVYVFDLDLTTPGHSDCNGSCAQFWPPQAPTMSTLPAPWSSILRTDGTMQLAYNGRPLYTFTEDKSPGQANGDGVTFFGGTWHIARPLSSSPSPGPSPTSMPTPY